MNTSLRQHECKTNTIQAYQQTTHKTRRTQHEYNKKTTLQPYVYNLHAKSNATQIRKQCAHRPMAMRKRYERITDARRVRSHATTITTPSEETSHTNAKLTQHEYNIGTIRTSHKDNTNTTRRNVYNSNPI